MTSCLFGEFRTVYVDDLAEIVFVRIVKGGCSERRFHRWKDLDVLVIEGQVRILDWEGESRRENVLSASSSGFHLPAGHLYQFMAEKDESLVLEVFRSVPGETISVHDTVMVSEGKAV